MADKNSCVALYSTHDLAEEAVRVLQKAAFDIKKVSIVGKGYHREAEHPVGFYSIGIPKDSIIRYETALKSDHYLIIVHGDQQEVERAHEVLAASESTDVSIHLS